jgi:predicted phage terminase large subunit-like protein
MLAEDNDPLGRSPGERLWPDWYTEEQVAEARLDARTWAGLYQQRPAPEEGNFFKKDWLVEYRPADLPRDLHYYCSSDHACKTKQVNDRTCLLPAGVDPNGRIWILPDWFWDRADTGVVVEKMLQMAQRRKPLRWWAGSDHITGSIGPFLSRRMQETGVYFPLDEVTSRGDKSARAQSIAGRMSQKMVMFPSYAPGYDKVKHEVLTFPGGTHDDFVDALSELGRGLDQIIKPTLTVRTGNSPLPNLNRPITMRWIKESHKRREREEANR